MQVIPATRAAACPCSQDGRPLDDDRIGPWRLLRAAGAHGRQGGAGAAVGTVRVLPAAAAAAGGWWFVTGGCCCKHGAELSCPPRRWKSFGRWMRTRCTRSSEAAMQPPHAPASCIDGVLLVAMANGPCCKATAATLSICVQAHLRTHLPVQVAGKLLCAVTCFAALHGAPYHPLALACCSGAHAVGLRCPGAVFLPCCC